MTQFQNILTDYVNWVRDDALPYWAAHAVDPAGGFYEKLDLKGAPVRDCPRRVRVQARQTYSYAHAAFIGWFDRARAISDHGWAFVTDNGMQGGARGSISHLVNDDGSLQNGLRDTYAQAFLLLASAWRVRAFNDLSAVEMIKLCCQHLDSLRSDHGGYEEADTPALPRRQNPHMHLFEAFMACYEATGDEAYLARAGEIFALFEGCFFDRKLGVLLEFFTDDWQPDEKLGDLIEPGHMMEWVWLLRWYETLSGASVDDYADTMFDNAIRMGMNGKTGLLYDEMKLDGTVTKPSSRSWSTTEYIKAAVAQHQAGRDGMLDQAGMMTKRLMDTYLSTPEKGGWYDQFDADGKLMSQHMETSTFYHLVCCGAVISEVL